MSLTLDGTTGISTTGNIVGNNISITGAFAPTNLSATGNIQGGNLLTGGLLSATGNVTGNYLLGNGTFITGLSASKIFNGTSEANIGTSGGNANITIGGTSNVVVVSTAGVSVSGTVQASGNITGGNISIGSGLSTAGSYSASGNVTGGNVIYGTGVVSGTGTVYAATVNAATIGNASAVHNGATVSVTGNISASYFIGNGYTLTSINGANVTGLNTAAISNGTSNVTIATSGGNITASVGGTPNVVVTATTGISVAGTIQSSGNIVTSTNGYIGIGTATPDTELTILGTPQTVSYPVTGNSTTVGSDIHITGADGSQTRIVQDSFGTGSYVAFTGRTGRGTAAAPTQTQSGDPLAQFTARGYSNGTLQFGNTSTGRLDMVAAENFTDTSRATNVQIFTTATGAITPTAVATFSSANGLSVTGNITGGNITTAGQLTVNSGANVTAIVNGATSGVGNIGTLATAFNTVFAKATTAQYADLAEVYTADATYLPGTVVSFGGTQEITISSISHNTQVAGIVSTQPAYLMNSTLSGAHTAEVALTGRVPCKVTGTIHKGDRLVASEIAGVAGPLDTAQYQPGCIIGKALEEWNSGEIGTIEVAVGRT